MDKSEKPAAGRRPYVKPRLRVIELVAEEVLAAGCKVAGGGGGPVTTCTFPDTCFTAGT